MPPIIEDYAAIKRRMDGIGGSGVVGWIVTEAYVDPNGTWHPTKVEPILTDEGRALIEKHKG